MDYYGLLFLYYLKGLSGKSVLRLFFNIEAGGTEQLLPENTSTPTTTPILADIQYPDGLRTDQYFTYRETLTTVSNKARIKTIKGNTLVWNQLVQNGNFADGTNNWTAGGSSTISASNGELTVTVSGAWNNDARQNLPLVVGHKYLGTFKVKSNTLTNIGVTLGQFGAVTNVRFATTDILSPTYQTVSGIAEITESTSVIRCTLITNGSEYVGQTFTIKDVMFFDLTQMGLDITDPSDFTSLFPLSYYSYNQGSLLSFNGNGIKTVGKNLLEPPTSGSVNGVTFTVNNDGSITVNGTATSNGTYDLYRNQNVLPSWVKAGETYTLSLTNAINRFDIFSYDSSGTSRSLASVSAIASQMFTIPNDAVGLLIRMFVSSGITYDVTVYPQIEIGTSATSYEPYTSSTLSLPISTYFPTGMKSAGSVHDELTPTKAITRIGAVDLGTITYTYDGECFIGKLPSDAKVLSDNTETLNSVSDRYLINNWSSVKYLKSNMTLGTGVNRYICIFNNSYTDATAFKTAMSEVYLYYELATSTETPITTEDANEALSLLMGKSVSSNNAKQMIDIITKGE